MTSQQLFERRKLIRELEKRKKETISRKKRVSKVKAKKQQNIEEKEDKQRPTSTPTATSLEPEQYDALIESLQPIEVDGVAFSKGNRTLLNINLSFNVITDQTLLSFEEQVRECNTVIQHITLTGNPGMNES